MKLEGRQDMTLDQVCIFVNDTATTEIYALALHDALPICDDSFAGRADKAELRAEGDGDRRRVRARDGPAARAAGRYPADLAVLLEAEVDRKSTRLNSSHANISYSVFCLK